MVKFCRSVMILRSQNNICWWVSVIKWFFKWLSVIMMILSIVVVCSVEVWYPWNIINVLHRLGFSQCVKFSSKSVRSCSQIDKWRCRIVEFCDIVSIAKMRIRSIIRKSLIAVWIIQIILAFLDYGRVASGIQVILVAIQIILCFISFSSIFIVNWLRL